MVRTWSFYVGMSSGQEARVQHYLQSKLSPECCMVVDDVRRMLLSFKGICRSQMLMHQGLNLDRTPGSLGTMMKIKTAFSIVGKVSK